MSDATNNHPRPSSGLLRGRLAPLLPSLAATHSVCGQLDARRVNLPSGFQIFKKTRTTGATSGHIDSYYRNADGKVFRSIPEVKEFFNPK